MLDGVDAGRPVLLRKVSPSEAPGLELMLRSAQRLTHPAIAKTLALTTTSDAMYSASEYVDGVTIFELTQILERAGAGLDVRVATRVVADALRAADQIGGLLRGVVSPRCIFADTVWIAAYGGTLISEPFLADLVQPDSFGVELSSQPDGNKTMAALDAVLALGLLFRLVLGRARGPLLPVLADSRMPKELLELMDGREGWTRRSELENALRRLPSRLFGSKADVAAVVNRWVGPTLTIRRELASPRRIALHVGANDDATATFVQPLWRAETAGPESSVERLALHAPFGAAENDDDQEVTTAFRPSLILRSSALANGTAQLGNASVIIDGNVTQSGVNPRADFFQSHEKRPRRALAHVALVMVLIALVVWGLSHLLVRT